MKFQEIMSGNKVNDNTDYALVRLKCDVILNFPISTLLRTSERPSIASPFVFLISMKQWLFLTKVLTSAKI